MKTKSLLVAISMLSFGCASIDNLDQIKSSNNEVTKKAYEEAKEANSKFFFNEFNDEYEGKDKIQKLAIAFFHIGWDAGQEWRKKTRFMEAAVAPTDYQAVVDSSFASMKAAWEKLGYEVLTPSELAAKSPTFAALKASGTFEYSPNFGQELTGLSVKDSRYIDTITNQGALVSKINSEAGIDALVGVFFNDVGLGAGETKYRDNFVLTVNSNVFMKLNICVSRERAKAQGVSLGLFGDANHCGETVGEFSGKYLLPDLRHKDKSDFEALKKIGFEGLSQAYTAASKGLVESIYEEGMKE